MQKKEIQSKVCEAVSKLCKFNNDNIQVDADLRDNYGIDSIVLVELLVELEDAFDMTFDSSSLSYDIFSTINSITDYIDGKLNS